jgi:hypothetical protein
MTLPILPVDKDGEVRWDLFRFDEKYSRWVAHESRNRIFNAPPKEYYKVRKISLYEYLITHEIPKTYEKLVGPEEKTKEPVKYVQGMLFDMDALDETGTVEVPEAAVSKTGEYEDQVEVSIDRIHQLNAKVNIKGTIGQVTHILIDRDIPAASQRDLVTYLAKRSRDRMASEKIHFMSVDEINSYVAGNPCDIKNTVVLLSDASQLGSVKGDVNMLVVSKDGVTDFVNLEGLLGISRSVLNKDWDAFRQFYAAMTGAECPQIRAEWLDDPVLFARNIIITLPPVSIIDIEEQQKLNDRLKELLVAA